MKKMKRILLVGAIAVGYLVEYEIVQAEPGTPRIEGSVHVTGAVLDKGCDVPGDSKSLSIELGQLDISSFGGMAGATSGAGVIEIPLINCPVMSGGVGIVFDGPANLSDTRLLALQGKDAAEGVGIAFYESDSTTQIPLYRQSEFKPIAEGQTAMLLRYILKFKSTSKDMAAGTAEAVANFALVYN
ncbi:fimbrial protein [Pseudomonas sp. SIMBA_041]|uniref:fimbrial protein n=1 Tax=Pseudomonas sp. SIMBA_041 TaxID=3085782 RepID=UPI00397B6F74